MIIWFKNIIGLKILFLLNNNDFSHSYMVLSH